MNQKIIVFSFGKGLSNMGMRATLAEFATSLGNRGYMVYADTAAKDIFERLGNKSVLPLENQIEDPVFRPTICVIDAGGVESVPVLNAVDDWSKAGTFVIEQVALADIETRDFILPLLSIGPHAWVSETESLREVMSEAAQEFYNHFQALRETIPAMKALSEKEDCALTSIEGALSRLGQNAGVVECVRAAIASKGWQLLRDWLHLEKVVPTSAISSGQPDT